MKCLTLVECQQRLAPSGVSISEHGYFIFPKRQGSAPYVIKTDLPIGASKLMWFFSALVDWLPNGCNRMLWLSKWLTYPPDQVVVFEKLRRGCGELRHIVEAPGHLFVSSTYENYEGKSDCDVEEDGILAAMLLLMVSFDWEGYLVADNSDDRILIGDEYLEFCSVDILRIQRIIKIAKSYKLKYESNLETIRIGMNRTS